VRILIATIVHGAIDLIPNVVEAAKTLGVGR
jgi:hypothetical protein